MAEETSGHSGRCTRREVLEDAAAYATILFGAPCAVAGGVKFVEAREQKAASKKATEAARSYLKAFVRGDAKTSEEILKRMQEEGITEYFLDELDRERNQVTR